MLIKKKPYVARFGCIFQDEADDFSCSRVDLFVPDEGHVVGERLDVPENTKLCKDLPSKQEVSWKAQLHTFVVQL